MAELITGLSAQPDFPNRDLTDENAALLELLLSNQELVNSSHDASERMSWVFKVGHKVVGVITGNLLNHDSRFDALNHGASLYEAMSLLLAAAPVQARHTFTIETQAAAWLHADQGKLVNYQEEAYSTFSSNLPKAKEVITGAADRFYPHLSNYAILGAAMAHQFEIDTAA